MGKGVRNVRSGVQRDLYCHVVIETPVKLSEYQKKLLQEFDESIDKNKDRHNPLMSSLGRKCKKLNYVTCLILCLTLHDC